MAINFPNSPSDGQQLTEGSVTYTYNATKGYWESTESSSASSSSTTVVANMTALIALTGMSDGDQALVQATNKLYMYSGTGWYLIATIQNDAPSAITGVSGTYELAIDGTATTITAVSTDPEGFPLTWSYSTSGLGSIATVNQSDNVFTITPSTTEADAGTFTLTINATDGVNGAVNASTNLTLEFILIITNSKYTTLLATAAGTSDNNNITDASTNTHSITVNGDAHAGTFSPYRSGGYSGLFDSTSVVQLSFAGSSDFEFSSVNFTIEMWFKWNSSSKPETTIFSNRISGSTFGTGRYFLKLMPGDSTSGGIEFAFDCGSPRYRLYCVDNLTADNAFFDEGWHHYAAVRNSTSLKLFVDGQEVDEITLPFNETNFGNSSDIIGLGINNGVSSPTGPDGEYRDVRIVKGVAITPPSGGPTEPLDAVSGTTFLLYNGEGYVKDKTSNHSPTYGSTAPTITATSPYDNLEYSVTDHGGSVYFDGTGDYIEHQGTFTLPAGTNANWTIECWVNLDQVNLNQGILRVSSTPANGNNDDIYFSEQTGYINVACKAGGIAAATSNYKMTANTWHHIAMVKNSGTIYLYNNGVYCGSLSDNNDYSGSYYVYGGLYYSSSYCFAGHLSDFRISNSAIYTSGTSNFTPPTEPISSTNSLLHIKGTDASIIDKAQGANLKLVGNTTGSATQTKFSNTKSMYFDGSGDSIITPTDVNISSTGAYTWEAWCYFETVTGWRVIFGSDQVTGRIAVELRNSKLALNQSGTVMQSGSTVMSTGQWYHLAISRQYGAPYPTTRFFVNGQLDQTQSSWQQGVAIIPQNFYIGSGNSTDSGNSAGSMHGYMQDVRFTEGLTRYTANFTPPTASLKG